MNNIDFAKLYSSLWTDGLWATSWSKAVADLSAQQANWKPSPDRKSIWQIAHHVKFWRVYHLDKLEKGASLPEDQIMKQHFADPADPSPAAWDELRTALKASHMRLADAMAGDRIPIEKLAPILAHDAYHLGQVMYVRGLQGLKPLE